MRALLSRAPGGCVKIYRRKAYILPQATHTGLYVLVYKNHILLSLEMYG